MIFFAYIGFDAVSVAAQEARNPQRDMPIGILGSLVVCTILYILVSGVMVGLVPYKQMKGSPAPMVVAISAAAGRAAGTSWAPLLNAMKMLVELGAIAGLSSVMVVMMMAQPRIFYSMANDGLLPAGRRASTRGSGRRTSRQCSPASAVSLAAGFTPIGVLGAAREHRHAAGVRHRLARRAVPAPAAAGAAPAVQDARCPVHPHPLRARELRADGGSALATHGSG